MAADDTPRPGAGDDRDDAPQPKIVVEDPEDFAKTRQLRSIFDARDDYIEARRDANRLLEEGELSMAKRNRRVFRYLQDLAMTIKPLMQSYDAGQEIWDEHTYGHDSFVAAALVPSTKEAKQRIKAITEAGETPDSKSAVQRAHELRNEFEEARDAKAKSTRPSFGPDEIGGIESKMRKFATPWGWEVQGLGQLTQNNHRLKYYSTERKRSTESQFDTSPPPQEVCDAAFSDIQDFIREIGLGVQFNEEQQTKIDDDLLQEVDQWRRTNVK